MPDFVQALKKVFDGVVSSFFCQPCVISQLGLVSHAGVAANAVLCISYNTWLYYVDSHGPPHAEIKVLSLKNLGSEQYVAISTAAVSEHSLQGELHNSSGRQRYIHKTHSSHNTTRRAMNLSLPLRRSDCS